MEAQPHSPGPLEFFMGDGVAPTVPRALLAVLAVSMVILSGCTVTRLGSWQESAILPDPDYPVFLPMQEWQERVTEHVAVVHVEAVHERHTRGVGCLVRQFDIDAEKGELVLSERIWVPQEESANRAIRFPGIMVMEIRDFDHDCQTRARIQTLSFVEKKGGPYTVKMGTPPGIQVSLLDQWTLEVSGEEIQPGEKFHLEYTGRPPRHNGMTTSYYGDIEVKFLGTLPIENIRVEERDHYGEFRRD